MILVERRPDGSTVAVAEVAVGVDRRSVAVPLGTRASVDPGGLRGAPVVVVAPLFASLAAAGAALAGRAHVTTISVSAATAGPSLLDAAAEHEAVVVACDDGEAAGIAIAARALGGRPLPALPFGDAPRVEAILRGCWIDLDIAIPAHDADVRAAARATASDLGLADRHHLVEVDPRPALTDRSEAGLEAFAAAATGVLAGRLAAGNRAWR